MLAGLTQAALGGSQQRRGVLVLGVEREGVLSLLPHGSPVPDGGGGLGLVQEAVYLALDAFAGHAVA